MKTEIPQMKTMRLEAHGAPLRLCHIPRPEPGPGEVQVRLAACGLNFADLLMIEGRYQEKPSLPATLGMEFAGRVTATGVTGTGPDVTTRLAPGMRVATYAGLGGLAEYAVVPVDRCIPLPERMTEVEAAGFLIAYGTSHVALGHRAQMQAGERLLVTGAAGGVGLTAVELGKVMGAEVIAVARGPEKLAVAAKAGADHLIDSENENLSRALKALGGVDILYDPVGGAVFEAALRACNPGARLLPLGFASGQVPRIPANYLLVKNLTVHGLYWGGYARLAPKVVSASIATLFTWYNEGRLHPHIGHVLPFEDTNRGLSLLRNRQAKGKIVIEIA